MEITKIGHCCLLIKVNGLTILTDPGMFSTDQNKITGIDVVLITHEHGDHLHVDSVKEILKNNSNTKIVTNTAVGNILSKENIAFEILEHQQEKMFGDVLIEGFGNTHADIYRTVTPVQNTGFFIAGRFFYPGDALSIPSKPVEILALPMIGPWIKLSEVIDYGRAIKPKKCFPVHDAVVAKEIRGIYTRLPAQELSKEGIEFVMIEEGNTVNF